MRVLKYPGTANKLRMCINRSNRHFYVQFINDEAGKTVVSYSTVSRLPSWRKEISKIAFEVSKDLQRVGIDSAFFDRGNTRPNRIVMKYKGIIKSFVEALRLNNIKI